MTNSTKITISRSENQSAKQTPRARAGKLDAKKDDKEPATRRTPTRREPVCVQAIG